MTTRLLVIDDDSEISDFLKMILTVEGFEVDVENAGLPGLTRLKDTTYDLIIMDLGLPDIEGEQLCRVVRKEHRIPVIILSAKDSVSDKVLCLEYGADDYITKPFESLELIARIKAVLRRFEESDQSGSLKGSDQSAFNLNIDTQNQIVFRDGEKIDFTPKEYELLIYFSKHRGATLERDRIIEDLWGKHNLYRWSRSLDVHIQHIRSKIEKNPKNPEYIQTVSGVGYKIAQ